MAIEKPLKLGTVKAIPLDNGPIRRELSIVLLNGPDPRGPVGQLVELLREHGANRRRIGTGIRRNEESRKVVVMGNGRASEFEGILPE